MKKPLISVVIVVWNEEKRLPRCLKSVKKFADDLVVVDNQSTDRSKEIAKEHGARVFSHDYSGGYVEPIRNFAIQKALGSWVFVIDADEKINKSLADKLRSIALDNQENIECVLIPRKNIILGKWMQNSRWWPDYIPRFFKKGKFKWPTRIHQQPDLSGLKIKTLIDTEDMAIVHYNYESLDAFLEQTDRYANAQALELIGEKNYKLSSKDLVVKPVEEFLSRFFVGEAYKDGIHGLALSLLQSWVTLLTYLKVWEMDKYEERSLEPKKIKEIFKDAIYQLEYWRDDYIAKSHDSLFAFPIKLFLKIRAWLVRF